MVRGSSRFWLRNRLFLIRVCFLVSLPNGGENAQGIYWDSLVGRIRRCRNVGWECRSSTLDGLLSQSWRLGVRNGLWGWFASAFFEVLQTVWQVALSLPA